LPVEERARARPATAHRTAGAPPARSKVDRRQAVRAPAAPRALAKPAAPRALAKPAAPCRPAAPQTPRATGSAPRSPTAHSRPTAVAASRPAPGKQPRLSSGVHSGNDGLRARSGDGERPGMHRRPMRARPLLRPRTGHLRESTARVPGGNHAEPNRRLLRALYHRERMFDRHVLRRLRERRARVRRGHVACRPALHVRLDAPRMRGESDLRLHGRLPRRLLVRRSEQHAPFLRLPPLLTRLAG
jgi:hypothetical protein